MSVILSYNKFAKTIRRLPLLRRLVLFIAAVPIPVSALLWLSYYMPIKSHQFYHLSYFGFTLLPAILLSILLLVTLSRPRWVKVISGILIIPGLLLWILSVMVVSNDFKIH